MSTSSGAEGTPRRGRPARISQQKIVEAAIAQGLDSFSMQGIADRLGVTPPALYSHVQGREEVLELVNAALLRHMKAFASPASDWRGWLTDFARETRAHLAGSAATLIENLHGPSASVRVGIGEDGLRLLMDAGFTPLEAGYAIWLVFRLAVTAGSEDGPAVAGLVGDTATVLGPDAAHLPATRAVHDAFVSSGALDTFDFDLAVVLDGLARRVEGREARPGPVRHRARPPAPAPATRPRRDPQENR